MREKYKDNGQFYTGEDDPPKTAALVRVQYGSMKHETEICMLHAITFINNNSNHTLEILQPFKGHQSMARNAAIAASLKMCPKSTKFILMDSDSVFMPDAFIRLLRSDLDVVGAMFVRSQPDYYPCFSRKRKNGQDYCVYLGPMDGRIAGGSGDNLIGMGLTCIDRKVLEKVPPPWFAEPPDPRTGNVVRPDVYFCEKIQEYGYKIHCDTSIQTGHIKEEILMFRHFESYFEPYYKKFGVDEPEPGGEALWLGWNTPIECDLESEVGKDVGSSNGRDNRSKIIIAK